MRVKSETRRIIAGASVYAGIIMGAGFASGQELMQFFVKHGYLGAVGVLVSGSVLAVLGYVVMNICVINGINDYREFVELVLGKKIGRVLDYIVNIFIGVLFCAMLAGAGSVGAEAFSVPFGTGACIAATMCFVALLFGAEGIIRINVVLAPLLIVSSIFFGVYTMAVDYEPVFGVHAVRLGGRAVWSGVVYAAYNVITAVSVLSGMGSIINSRRTAKWAGLLGGACIGGICLFFTLPLIVHFDTVKGLEIPMLALAQRYGGIIESIYLFILVTAIFTATVSNAFALTEWLHKRTGVGKIWIRGIVCIFGVIASRVGFSAFTGKVYPLFGYVGLFEIVVIIVYFAFGNTSIPKGTKKPFDIPLKEL